MWNQVKTAMLLGGLSGILLLMGWLFGGQQGLTIALGLSFLMNFFAYFFSESMVLRMYRAKKLDPVQYDWIYRDIQELSQKMGIPMPKLWIVDTPVANAFATGRNPSHASVAVTTGILSLLNQEELRGVLAHELSHVKNRDILVSTVAAVLATAISYLANMMYNMAFWESMSGSRRREGGVGPVGVLILTVLTPIAAGLLQMAISRSREYLADESGAHFSRTPLALAAALEKLQNNVKFAHFQGTPAEASTSPLFIVKPFLGGGWLSLFSTHPSTQSRIERLQKMRI